MNHPATEQVRIVALAKLRESPSNPRRKYPQAELQELADSIKSQGVMQPIVARPIPEPQQDPEHEAEIVFGHRRFLASALAGLTHIPVLLRAMSDEEAAIAQVHENAKRRDVNAVEEADSFMHLHIVHKMSAEDIAKAVGKSKSYVYGRLKITQMADIARLAVEQDGLPAEIALELARLPSHKLQANALTRLFAYKQMPLGQVRDGWISFRQAAALLRGLFSIRLVHAKFDQEQDLLGTNNAVPCVICPKRAENDPELRDELEADVCTDKACFDDKTKAHEEAEYAAAEARAKAVMAEHNEKHRQSLVASQTQLGLADQPQTASTPTSSCASANGGAAEQAQKSYDPFEGWTPEKRAVGKYNSWLEIKRAILEKANGTERTTNELRLIITGWLYTHDEVSPHIFALMGLPDDALGSMHGEDLEAVLEKLPKLNADELGRLLMLLVLDSEAWSIQGQDVNEDRLTLAAHYGVDVLNPSGETGATPTPGCAGAAMGVDAPAGAALDLAPELPLGQENKLPLTAAAEDTSQLTAAHAAGASAKVSA